MKKLLFIAVFTCCAILSKGQTLFYADRYGDISYDKKDNMVYGDEHKVLIKITYDTVTNIIQVADGFNAVYHLHEQISDTTVNGFHTGVYSAIDKNHNPCFIKISLSIKTNNSEMDILYIDKRYGFYYMINDSIKF